MVLQYQIPLTVVSYKELYGWTMDEIVREVGTKNNCTFCGVFRRIPMVDDHVIAGAGRVQGQGAAHPPRGAGDQRIAALGHGLVEAAELIDIDHADHGDEQEDDPDGDHDGLRRRILRAALASAGARGKRVRPPIRVNRRYVKGINRPRPLYRLNHDH